MQTLSSTRRDSRTSRRCRRPPGSTSSATNRKQTDRGYRDTNDKCRATPYPERPEQAGPWTQEAAQSLSGADGGKQEYGLSSGALRGSGSRRGRQHRAGNTLLATEPQTFKGAQEMPSLLFKFYLS